MEHKDIWKLINTGSVIALSEVYLALDKLKNINPEDSIVIDECIKVVQSINMVYDIKMNDTTE